MPGDDISIYRRWEGIELEPGTPGRKNVVLTINDADRTEDRRATVQAVETLLIALMGREAKAKAAALRAEADKLDPPKPTRREHDCARDGCCDCRSVERECCYCEEFDD